MKLDFTFLNWGRQINNAKFVSQTQFATEAQKQLPNQDFGEKVAFLINTFPAWNNLHVLEEMLIRLWLFVKKGTKELYARSVNKIIHG